MVRGCGETGRRSRLKICFPSWECGFESRRPHHFFRLVLPALLASCSAGLDDGPIAMSVIGSKLALANPDRMPLGPGDDVMLAATAQGLVAFDAEGRIEPGLAERWIVTDDGLSYIFRIRRTEWSDGREVTAKEVAARLKTMIAPDSRNAIKPLFSAVERITGMTGQVIEIRLRTPQPDFLQLLAQPEAAIFKTRPSVGTGPYHVHSTRDGVTRLRPIYPEGEEPPPEEIEQADVRVRAESAPSAIARFAARDIALVTGGGFADLALVRAARPASSQFQVDPAYGLFGLAVLARSTALEDINLRRALAMAIDRDRIVELFGVNRWRPSLALLPAQLDSTDRPAALDWVQLDLANRRAQARAYVARQAVPELRVALPEGAGSRLLFAALADDWRRIGVSARLVDMGQPADLRVIDEVAPQSSAIWYLTRVSCGRGMPCIDKAELALKAALAAPTARERSDAIASADAAFTSEQIYIPIALPLRWSLVAPQLVGWRPSAFAIHPLRRLRPSD